MRCRVAEEISPRAAQEFDIKQTFQTNPRRLLAVPQWPGGGRREFPAVGPGEGAASPNEPLPELKQEAWLGAT